jgi:UDP-glucose 4-epimerase
VLDTIASMRVVITGGAGFIGRHLVQRYVASGHETLIVDDFSASSARDLPPGVELIRADIADPATGRRLARAHPDVVIHAAAQVSVSRSLRNPTRDRELNVVGTENVLRGARGARRFVFVSSGGAVYGEAVTAREGDPARPVNFYGVHKWTAERYVMLSGLPYAIARPANVYGPGQRSDLEGGVVAIFCERARKRQPLSIYGDGEQCRDFVHVRDVVRAIAAMAETRHVGTWNVGTGVATSLNELASLVEKARGQELQREHLPPRPGDARLSTMDISAAVAQLGWRPEIALADGLQELV